MQRGGGDADPGCTDAEMELQAARSRSPRREGLSEHAVLLDAVGAAEWEIQRKHAPRRGLALDQAKAALALAGWTPDKIAQWQWLVEEATCDAGGAMTEERQPNQWRYEQTPDEQEDEWPWGNWVEINTGGDTERCFVKAGTKMWADWRGHQWYRVAQHGQRASEWHDCGPHVVGQRGTSTPTE